MRNKIFQAVLLCGIVLSPSFAVVNNSSAEASRRQTHLSDSYGSPIPADSYGPPQKEDLGLPIPVYGAPDQVQYPAPPPDIPPPPGPPAAQYGPPAQSFNLAAGPPSQQYGPPAAHGPPSPEYGPPPGPPSPVYGPPPGPPKPVYGPPPGLSSHIQGPSKSYFGPPPSFNKPHFGPPKYNYGPPPKPYYGPPPPYKQNYVGPSKPHYGPPLKPHYGPPLKEYFGSPPVKYGVPAQQYGPPNFKLNIPPNQSYGPPPNIPHVVYGSPKPNTSYGPPPGGLYGPPLIKPEPTPSVQYGPPPSPQYGPPPTNYHELPPPPIIGPPKQGIPAPPTPPDIKYDGWKPIPGLSLPNLQHNHNDIQAHALLAPPNSYGLPIAEAVPFNNVPTDSYGAPISFGLNQGQTQVQTLHTSTLDGNDLPGLDLNIFGDQQQSVQSSNAIFEAHIIENIDGNSLLNQNLPQVQTIQLTSGHDEPLNVLQSDGLELFNNFNNDIKRNVLPPPLPEISNSYGVPQSSYFHQEGPYPPSGQPARLNFGKGIGLTPPSGIYGVPPGGHYSHGLALQHGTQSGNLAKGWNRGPPPRHPVSFRPPVPQGLIESIGYNVQHLDSLGFDLPSKENVYLPPPVAPPSQLNALPQYGPPRQQFYQAPSQHRECNSHGNQIDQSFQQQPYQQYGAPNQDLQSAHSVDTQLRASAPEIAPNKQTSEQHAEHSETVTVQKSVGVESESSAEDAPQYQAQTETQTTNQQHVDSQTQVLDHIQVQDAQDDQTTQIQVQPSHAITLPLQGRLGTYSLQIQSADSLGSNDDGGQPPPHEQLLSEGLLQSILAAIEQPQQTASIGGIVQSKEYAQPLSALDNNEVAVYLKDTSDQNEGNHE